MTDDLGSRVLRGAAWTIAGRWSLRLVGLFSTAILARLLTPADFGLVAMGMIVIGLVEAVFDLGIVSVLLRRTDTTDADFDTAWTVGLIQGALVSMMVAASAPFATAYFNEPRVETLLWVLAPLAFLRAFENIGMVKFQKDLDFHKTVRFDVGKRVTVSILTIGAALWFRDYRALLAGNILGTLAAIGISYAIQSYRPRLTLAKVRDIWHVSKWIMLMQVGNYFTNAADRTILGNRVDVTSMGHYTVGAEIAQLPYDGAIAPTNRVLLPVFALVKHSPERLAKAYARALGAQSMLGLPVSAGIAIVAPSLVDVVFGSQWLQAIPILQLLAGRGAVLSMSEAGVNLAITMNRHRQFAWWRWLALAAFVSLAVWGFPRGGPLVIASLVFMVSVMSLAFNLGFLVTMRLVPPSVILGALWRPMAGTMFMILVLSFGPLTSLAAGPTRLGAEVALGAASYALTVLGLWRLAGMPGGIEEEIFSRLPFPRRRR